MIFCIMFIISGGGGGYFHYVCILGMCRRRDPHFQSWISVPEHIIFTNYPKNPFREHHHFKFFGGFWRPFRRPSFSKFLWFNPFIASHGRLSPNALRSAAPRISSRSGDLHFHAQNGSSSFRSPAFSRSKRLKLVPEPRIFKLNLNGSSSFRSPTFSRSTGSSFRSPCPFFTLPRHIPTKVWGEYPPGISVTNNVISIRRMHSLSW